MKIHTAVLNQQRLLSLFFFLPLFWEPLLSSCLGIANEEAVLSVSVSSLGMALLPFYLVNTTM